MSIDKAMRRVAKTLIKSLGKTDITLRRATEAVYNLTTGVSAPTTADETPIAAVVSEYSKRELGASILADDVKLIIAATATNLTAAPTKSDQVIIDSTVLRIVNVTPYYAGSTVAAYHVQARNL